MAHPRFPGNLLSARRRSAIGAGLRSLRVHILLWTIVPITVFLLGLSFTDVYGHQQAMRTMVEERDRSLAQAVAGRIGDGLAQNARLLQALAADSAFAGAAPEAQQQLLDRLGAPFEGVAMLDGAQKLRGAWGDGRAWAEAAFVARLAEAAHTGAGPAYLAGAHDGLAPYHLAVAVALPGDGGTLVGVLPLARSAVPAGVEGLLASPQAYARLLDEEGRPLYEAGAPLSEPPEGDAVVTTSEPVPGTGWRVEVAEPWHSLVPLVLRYAQATVLIAAAAVLISLASVYVGVRYVTGPLGALGERARRVAWGDFDAVAQPVGGVEEIASLQRALQQMAAQVRSYQAAMRSYVGAITRAQEEERIRLARELHDDTVQSLIALGQRMERMQKSCAHEGDGCAAELGELRQSLRGLVHEVRRVIADLRPTGLDELGLEPALEMLVGRLPASYHAAFGVEGTPRRLAPDLELALYRIAQEALKNVEQHSSAGHVEVRLRFEEQGVRLLVADDGAGFEAPSSPDELARDGHYGLLGMRERAVLAGGWLTVASSPGRGTQVEAYLPSS